MTLVSVNGVLQIPGIDYVTSKDQLSFATPPAMGSIINVRGSQGNLANVYGDGSTYLFHIVLDSDVQNNLLTLFEDLAKCYDHPAVAEAVERLSVVIALVKEDGRSNR